MEGGESELDVCERMSRQKQSNACCALLHKIRVHYHTRRELSNRAEQFIVLCSLLIPPKFFAVSGRLFLIISLHIINVGSSSS